jgi:signal transduction histidine kinase/DNA-binding response OmpR family regulator
VSDGARILVVDDDRDMREYLARVLGTRWTVEAHADGDSALASARDRPPDLVLSDLALDGPRLLDRLRADPDTCAVPVIFLSPRDSDQEGPGPGADDYLVKPFADRELLARVRTHLELSRLRTDAATLRRISGLLAAELDVGRLLQLITDEALRLVGGRFGAFFYNQAGADGEKYLLYTLSGAPREAFEGFPMPRNTAVFGPTFAGEGIVRVDDITRDPRYGKNAPYHGMPEGHLPVRSYLAAPVVSRTGAVYGGLFFGHPQEGMFTERAERLLEAVAAQGAIAIDNARLYERSRLQEDQVRQLLGREQEARGAAESANRAKDEFLAMLGHELRNPLAPILTALELMSARGITGGERERMVIERQVSHLVRLVDDLLDVSRITRGKIHLSRQRVELADVVARAVEMASPLMEEKRQTLYLDLPPSGLTVFADPVRLAQVVTNLLINAARYTGPSGTIWVSAGLEQGVITLRVRDDGVGMSPEMLDRVFVAFVQERQALDRAGGGLGVGLTIVRSLVQMHGGTVEAYSEGNGRGSEFVVRLPPSGEELPASRPGPATLEARRAAARRVLVVDDNHDAADLLSEALRHRGNQVETAYDGPSALALAAAFLPEVAFIDLGLPVMDGYELAQLLRQDPALPGIRLVAVTGYGLESDRVRARNAGFDAHLVKPVMLDQVDEQLAISRRPRASS